LKLGEEKMLSYLIPFLVITLLSYASNAGDNRGLEAYVIKNGSGTVYIPSSGSITANEISYLSGTTSNLQDQIDAITLESLSGIVPLAKGGTNKNSTASSGSISYSDADSFELSSVGTLGQAFVSGGTGAPTWFSPTMGSVVFSGTGGSLSEDNTNFYFDDTNNYLKIKNSIQLGSVDAFSRTQIWNYGSNASLRLGSLTQDGDPTDVNSEGSIFYGANSQGTAINSGTGDFGYARVKADRFGLYTSILNVAGYYFRVDPTSLYLATDSLVKTFEVDRATGQIDTSLGSGIVHSNALGILTASSLLTTEGGTGLSSYNTGDILYASASNTLSNRSVGAEGYIMTVVSGVPDWAEAPSSNIPVTQGTRQTGISISTGTSITPTSGKYSLVFVSGSSGAVVVTASPPVIVSGMVIGQKTKICGTSDTNTVTYNNSINLVLNGSVTLGKDQCIDLDYYGSDGSNPSWVESSARAF
jgi:hypothetical protein